MIKDYHKMNQEIIQSFTTLHTWMHSIHKFLLVKNLICHVKKVTRCLFIGQVYISTYILNSLDLLISNNLGYLYVIKPILH